MGKFYEEIASELIQLVRTLAWLNAVPEAPPTGKGPIKRKAVAERKSRLQILKEKNRVPDLPEVSAGQYLVDYLLEVGPVSAAGMGSDRITCVEISKWMELIGITLAPWEVRLLRRLSGEYAGESHRATAHDCPPPWMAEPSETDRETVAKGLQSAFRERIDMQPKR